MPKYKSYRDLQHSKTVSAYTPDNKTKKYI